MKEIIYLYETEDVIIVALIDVASGLLVSAYGDNCLLGMYRGFPVGWVEVGVL